MSHGHGEGADSAGLPWAGRRLSEQPWADDDGQADPRLSAAVARYAQAPGDAEALRDLSGLLLGARLLVPVVARAVDEGEGRSGADPAQGDRGAEMSVPLLAAPQGGTSLPAFTGLSTLSSWDPAARPVPAAAPVVAAAALAEGCLDLLLDPGPGQVRLTRPVLAPLAGGSAWTPAWEDAEVAEALRETTPLCPPGVLDLLPLAVAEPLGLGVGVVLPQGWTAEQVAAVTQQVGGLLAADPRVAERVLSLRLVVRATS